MEPKAITLVHKPLIVYVIAALMLATPLLYFYISYKDYQELLQASMPSSTDSKDIAAASADDIQATRNT